MKPLHLFLSQCLSALYISFLKSDMDDPFNCLTKPADPCDLSLVGFRWLGEWGQHFCMNWSQLCFHCWSNHLFGCQEVSYGLEGVGSRPPWLGFFSRLSLWFFFSSQMFEPEKGRECCIMTSFKFLTIFCQ